MTMKLYGLISILFLTSCAYAIEATEDQLIDAIKNHNESFVENYIKEHKNINFKHASDPKQETPFMISIRAWRNSLFPNMNPAFKLIGGGTALLFCALGQFLLMDHRPSLIRQTICGLTAVAGMGLMIKSAYFSFQVLNKRSHQWNIMIRLMSDTSFDPYVKNSEEYTALDVLRSYLPDFKGQELKQQFVAIEYTLMRKMLEKDSKVK